MELKFVHNRARNGILQKRGEVYYIEFPVLDQIDFIQHGFSTRFGGVSEGEFFSMNLSYTRGDRKENVDENYKRICTALDMDVEKLVLSDQVHDTVVYHATEKDAQGNELASKKLEAIDGLVTNTEGIVLCTSYADCVPLFFVDVKRKAIGLSHSGWRGTVGKIGKKTVEKMQEEFGTEPRDIIAVIGPSICQDCYEVSSDVAEEFMKILDESQSKTVLEKKKDDKYQLNLWEANRYILMEAGIPEQNITVSNVCTCCNSDILFSHRKTNGHRGNLCGFLKIKKN